jgi:serine/threonine protein kinase
MNPPPSSSLPVPSPQLSAMTDTSEHIETCPACGTLVECAGFEPLSRVSCPTCGEQMLISGHIAHYQLMEVVGRGGMGVVYKALDTSLNRMVALKVLRKDHSQNADLVAQLETEAAITASINHPFVVRVFTTGTDAGRFYIAMELVDKGTLDDLIGLQGQVAEVQVLEIATQIAQGLRAAYQHGLIHRDVKPGNILFADAHTAKIVDFGLAMLEAAVVGGGEIWGTPYYVAPEKLDQKPEDLRSDIYSLGATLFHALAGRPPFEAKDASMVALKHLKSQAVSLQAFAPHISGPTAYVINRTLLKNPDERYQSYDELIEHLEYARAELEKKGTKKIAKQRVVLETEQDKKLWSYVTFGMLGLVVLIGLGALIYRSSSKDDGTTAAPTGAVASGLPSGENSSLSNKYADARQLLIERKPEEAARAFQAIANDPGAPPLTVDWSLLHAGLAELFAGDPAEARAEFQKLQKRPALKGVDKEIADAIRAVALLAPDERPISKIELTNIPVEGAGAMAYLVLGLKNWNLGEIDSAGELLEEFVKARLSGDLDWVSKYKPLAADYVTDIRGYRGILLNIGMAATNPAKEKEARDEVAKAVAKWGPKSPLAQKLAEKSEELNVAVEKREKEAAAKATADKDALKRATEEIARLSKEWKFTEARERLSKTTVTTDSGRRERTEFVRKVEDLRTWKMLAIAAVNAAPEKAPLMKRGGGALPAPVAKATEDGIEIKGGAKVAWNEIAPEGLLAAVLTMDKSGDQAVLARYRYHSAVFAAFVGEKVTSEKLFALASEHDASYVPLIPLVLPGYRSTDENLAKGKTAKASGFVKGGEKNESPGQAFDGNAETKWCAKEAGPKWLEVDLGKPTTITRWTVAHASSGKEDTALNTSDFEFQVSADGKEWKTVDRVKDNRAEYTFRPVAPTEARHVRLHITKASQRDDTARINEFAVYGPGGETNADVAKSFFEPAGVYPTPALTAGDIGDTNPKGYTQIHDKTGEVTMRASGADIWKISDECHFAQQSLSGDGEIQARVLSLSRPDEWSKVGLMFRASLSPDSPNVFVGVTPAGRVTVQNRPTPGAETGSRHIESPGAPVWLKLVRQGSNFKGFKSADGQKWDEVHSVNVNLPPTVSVGLAATSHRPGQFVLASFDLVRITPKPGAKPGR